MAKRKNALKQKLSNTFYTKPSLEKRVQKLKKGFNEVSSMLNEKK